MSVLEMQSRAAQSAVIMHRESMDRAIELGRAAFGLGVVKNENPFRVLPLCHPLRENWNHGWELGLVEDSSLVPA
jgi:hypothetical protein